MWTKLKTFPWHATFVVLRHGFGIALKAAVLIEHSGLLKTMPQLNKVVMVGCALSDAAVEHPEIAAVLLKTAAKL